MSRTVWDDDEGEDEAELEVRWDPREIDSFFNESQTVLLTLNQQLDETVVVELNVKDGSDDAVEFLEQIKFPAGVTEVEVQITTREIAGEVKIRAALPFELGGDTDDLEILIVAGGS